MVSVLVLVTVWVTVGGARVVVEEEMLLVVEEPEDQSGAPTDNALREVPTSISSFCNPEFWRTPCVPQEVP